MHFALKAAAVAALVSLGFLAGLSYFAGQTPRLAVEPRTQSEPYAELTARINAALKNNEPERMARAAVARGDQRFLATASAYARAPGIACLLVPPARRINTVNRYNDSGRIIIIIGSGSENSNYETAVSDYLTRYNKTLVGARGYTDGDLCALKPTSDAAAEDAYPQLVYRGLIYELEPFDYLRRSSRALRDNSEFASADIFHAARWGNTSAVRRLLRFGARVNGTDAWSMTPLAWAALRGHADTVAALLAAKADPNRPAALAGWTPLMFGALGGNADIVRALLDHGAKADVHVAASPSHALTIAVNLQRPDLVELLLNHGAKPNFVDEVRTPLESAATRGDLKSMTLLLDNGAKAQRDEPGEDNDEDWYRVSALGWAGLGGHLDAVKLLLARGGDINWTNSDGDNSPLDGALEGLSRDVALYLLDHGADPNAGREKRGFGYRKADSPLAYAAQTHMYEAAKRMIARGADVHERQGNRRREAIFDAAGANDTAMVQLLLSAGANPNARDESGATPIFAAARQAEADSFEREYRGEDGVFGKPVINGNFSALETLVAHGADVNARDFSGNTALHDLYCNVPAMKALIRLGANPNIANAKGQTPLFDNLVRKCEEGVLALLEAGANPDVKDAGGRTPRDYAIHFKRDNVLATMRTK